MPNGTDAQVGFFELQSKQTYIPVSAVLCLFLFMARVGGGAVVRGGCIAPYLLCET